MSPNWRRVVSLDTPTGGRHAEMVDAWREEVWILMRGRARDLHREVLCGRLGLREAAARLEERGIPIGEPVVDP